MTRVQAEKLYNHFDKMVEKLTLAQEALISGGVKSYTIDDRSLTRFDLDRISAELDTAIRKREEYKAIMCGRSPRKAVGLIPRDI